MIQKIINFIKSKLLFQGVVTKRDLSMSALDIAIDTVVGNYIEGDYLEFGVYKGESFTRAYRYFKNKREEISRRFIAIDSFEGLPHSEEAHKPLHYKKGMYRASEENFKKSIARKGVNLSEVVSIPGFYRSSLTEKTKEKYKIRKAAVVYIDVDLYESAVPVFNFLTDIVDTGSVIVIDDWFRHLGVPTAGIQKACNEWLEKNPNIRLILLHQYRRVAFIVHKQ